MSLPLRPQLGPKPRWADIRKATQGTDCTASGLLFGAGEGGSQNDATATRLFQQACVAGDAAGCFNLGQALSNGTGIANDHIAALKSLQEGCDGGDPEGCFFAGVSY